MSSKLPSREQAIKILKHSNCPPQVINHCLAVTDLAVKTATKIAANGINVDIKLVEAGALLHDLGRSKSHGVDHAVVGAELAENWGLPEGVVRIIRRHVGGGITVEEADAFGWKKDVYVPESLEEKIVSFSDKLIDRSKRVPIEQEIALLEKENKHDAAQRVRRLHYEISTLLGNKK